MLTLLFYCCLCFAAAFCRWCLLSLCVYVIVQAKVAFTEMLVQTHSRCLLPSSKGIKPFSHHIYLIKIEVAILSAGDLSILYPVGFLLFSGLPFHIAWGLRSSQRSTPCWPCCVYTPRSARLPPGPNSRLWTPLFMILLIAAHKTNHRYWTSCKIDYKQPSS